MNIEKNIIHSINRRIMAMSYEQTITVSDIIKDAIFEDKLIVTDYEIKSIADALDVNTDCIFDVLEDLGHVSYENQTAIEQSIEIANAKLVLRQAGYYVDQLWHISDVKDRFDCNDDTAQDVLHDALTSEWTLEKIFEQISDFAETRGLEGWE